PPRICVESALRNLQLRSRSPPISASVHADLRSWARRPADRPDQSAEAPGATGYISLCSGFHRCALSGVSLRRFQAPDVFAALSRGGYFSRLRLAAAQACGADIATGCRCRTILGHPLLTRE